MAKGKSNANAWLARDLNDDANYALFVGGEPLREDDEDGQWDTRHGRGWFVCEIKPAAMDAVFPSVPKLAPGEGPIPVRISIERAE